MTESLHAEISQKPCGTCISKMIKNPQMNCRVTPGFKACVLCREKNSRCFPVPQEFEAELKALMAAKGDYEAVASEANSLNVRSKAEKLHELVAQAKAKTPGRGRKSKDLTAEATTEGARPESPSTRQTRQNKGRLEPVHLPVDGDGDNHMADHLSSPREPLRLEPRNLFGGQGTRRSTMTSEASQPASDASGIAIPELKRNLREILQVNTWTMRKTGNVVQKLTVSCYCIYVWKSEPNIIDRHSKTRWTSL